MEPLKFGNYKSEIIGALNAKRKEAKCTSCGEAKWVVVDGFINQPFQKELSASFVIGGPSIPIVAVVCNNCGLINYYALKALLPDINIK